MDKLKEFHQNKKRGDTYFEKLFPNNTAIHQFNQFYLKNAENLQLGAQVKLLELVEDPKDDYTARDIAYYKKGQADILEIFSGCAYEMELKRVQEELNA